MRWLLVLAMLGCSAPGGGSGGGGITGSGGTAAMGGSAGTTGEGGTGGMTADSGAGTGGTAGSAGSAGSAGTAGSAGSAGSAGMDGGAGTGGAGGSGCFEGTLDTTAAVAPPRKIKDLTGTASSSGQFGVGGTDLGAAVRQPNGKIAYIFGDTFEQDTVGGPGWRSPVLLRSEPGLDADGIDFNSAAGGTYAKQLFDYSHDNGRTWLPSDAITIGDRMYLHYIVNEGLGNVQWTQIGYSDDNGENWTVADDARWEANENNNLQQLWTWEQGCDGYVYVMSTKFISRDQALILHRVPEDKLLEKAEYEPWGYAGGAWAWGNPATIILDGDFGELSLRRVENKWVLSWFNAGDYDISVKVFDEPTSDLTAVQTYKPVCGDSNGCPPGHPTASQLYGGYIHPDSTLRNLHLIVSQWNTSNNWPYRAMQYVTSVE